MKFVLYEEFWWQYDEKTPKKSATLINMYGGINSGNDISKLKIVEAKSFYDLDWKGTKIYSDKYKYGWIDRNGKFYGCSYESHDLQARLVHHSTRRELEKQGWIHISKDMYNETGKLMANFCADYDNGVIPTDAQIFYLSHHKEINSDEVMYIYLNGNKEKARIYEKELQNKNKNDKENLM